MCHMVALSLSQTFAMWIVACFFIFILLLVGFFVIGVLADGSGTVLESCFKDTVCVVDVRA